jgi:hypothetical protein
VTAQAGRALFGTRDEVLQTFSRWGEVLAWYPDSTAALARVLTRAADDYCHASRPAATEAGPGQARTAAEGQLGGNPAAWPGYALAAYSAAYALDPLNGAAAVGAAATPSDHWGDLDKGVLGKDTKLKLLRDFRRQVFDPKAGLYAHVCDRDDWLVIFRCHVILAGIAEREQRWGPNTEEGTVLYELAAAGKALADARDPAERNAPAPPWIDSTLGKAYEQTGDARGAIAAYSQAAAGAVLADFHGAK